MNGWLGERGQARLEAERVRDPRGYNVLDVPFPDEEPETMEGSNTVITLGFDLWYSPMYTDFIVVRNVFTTQHANFLRDYGNNHNLETPEQQVKKTIQNRQNLLRAISIVAKAEDLPIIDISTNQHTEYDKSNQPFDFFQVTVTLGKGDYTRPGHTSKIIFYFSNKRTIHINLPNNNRESRISVLTNNNNFSSP